MKSATVNTFHALFIGHLTQHDRAEERREIKHPYGQVNIHRLALARLI